MALVMGVDSSTQSTKVEVRDAEDGRLVAVGRAPHSATQPPCSEQDAADWWEALREALVAAGSHSAEAVSVAGQQHGLVVLDAAGAPLRPAKLWTDTESAPESTELIAEFGNRSWVASVGSVPRPAFTITKLAWLARHEPATLDRVATVLLPHDFLTLRLTGRTCTDRGDASGTGYWSPRDGTWRTDLLDRFVAPGDWPGRLPEVLGPTEAAGVVVPDAASHLGLSRGAVVGPGTGDNMAAALGIGLQRGEVCVSLGTSGTVFARASRPAEDPTGIVAGFADADGGYLPLVCTQNATRVTEATARLLGVDEPTLDHLALSSPPGAGGVVVVPYFDGERTPNRPDATGTVTGLRSDVTREQLARASYEGVVCGLLDGLDALVTFVDEPPERLVLVGGGARSVAYRQILADLSGLSVQVRDGESVATGACVQAAATLHRCPIVAVQQAWSLGGGAVIEPDPSVDQAGIRAAYRQACRGTPDPASLKH